MTSQFEDFQRHFVSWSSQLYRCANAEGTQRLVKLDQNLGGGPRIVLTAHQCLPRHQISVCSQEINVVARAYRFTLSAATDQRQ